MAECRTTLSHMKEAMRRRVADGGRVGLLAYVNGEPAAWCSVAPRETFVRLGGVEQPGEDPGAVWSLTCFYFGTSEQANVPREMFRLRLRLRST